MKRTAAALILTLLGALAGAAMSESAAADGGFKLTVVKSGTGTGTVTSTRLESPAAEPAWPTSPRERR